MAHQGHLQPEQLARELKTVVVCGLRPPKLRLQLKRLPGLMELCSAVGTSEATWDDARLVADAITEAVDALGDGPYGRAASALFGTTAATRGLLKTRRRYAAAAELDTEVATFVRHWEADMLLDVAVQLLAIETGSGGS